MVKKVSVNNRLNQFGTLNYTDDVTQDDDATQDQMLTFGNNESVTQGEIVEEETKLGMMIFDENEASEQPYKPTSIFLKKAALAKVNAGPRNIELGFMPK